MKDRGRFEIGFGDLFRVKGQPDRVDVVIDIREGDYFDSARVREWGGKKYLAGLGTAGPENINGFVGQMTKDEIISAAEEEARRLGYELTGEQKETLEEYSRKGRREL